MADEIVFTIRHGGTDDAGVTHGALTGTTAITIQVPQVCTWMTLTLEPAAGATGTVIAKPIPIGADPDLVPAFADSTATLGTDAGLYSVGRVSFDRVLLTPNLSGGTCGFTLTVGR